MKTDESSSEGSSSWNLKAFSFLFPPSCPPQVCRAAGCFLTPWRKATWWCSPATTNRTERCGSRRCTGPPDNPTNPSRRRRTKPPSAEEETRKHHCPSVGLNAQQRRESEGEREGPRFRQCVKNKWENSRQKWSIHCSAIQPRLLSSPSSEEDLNKPDYYISSQCNSCTELLQRPSLWNLDWQLACWN